MYKVIKEPVTCIKPSHRGITRGALKIYIGPHMGGGGSSPGTSLGLSVVVFSVSVSKYIF